jgi:putative phosphoribosyl transferase
MESLFNQCQFLKIPFEDKELEGSFCIPPSPRGVILFVHGSGSSRLSPRNQFVAQVLNKAGLATLLFDLLTREEENLDLLTKELRFDIPLLTNRLLAVTDWISRARETKDLNMAYFGASTGAAAAILAAGERPRKIKAVVSRGGRPDLADPGIEKVKAPTLLIVGAKDTAVIQLNEYALNHLTCEKKLVLVPKARHLFEEPGTLEEVAEISKDWFIKYLS